MRVAICIWEDRISPVFDAAHQVTVFDLDGEEPRRLQVLDVAGQGVGMRTQTLRAAGVEILLCGAITRGWQGRLEAAGIRVIPFLTGRWRRLLAAFRAGDLDGEDYRMPGCRRQVSGCRRRQRGGARNGHEGQEKP